MPAFALLSSSPRHRVLLPKWRRSLRTCGAILGPAEKITESSSAFAHLRMFGFGESLLNLGIAAHEGGRLPLSRARGWFRVDQGGDPRRSAALR